MELARAVQRPGADANTAITARILPDQEVGFEAMALKPPGKAGQAADAEYYAPGNRP
jgi:hypothetical protein